MGRSPLREYVNLDGRDMVEQVQAEQERARLLAQIEVIAQEAEQRAADLGAANRRLEEQADALHAMNERLQAEITERKQAQQERERLLAEIQGHAASLEAANQELDSFAHSVSHDLRAPLRAISGFAQILLEDYSAELPASALKTVEVIRKNVDKMNRLIEALLSFSRLGRNELRKVAVAPTPLVRQVIQEICADCPTRPIEFEVAELPACQANPTLLKQVWINLVSNAVKFTRQCDAARIEVGAYVDRGRPVYYVRDNGTGFDMQYADRLFGVFQRLHREEDYEGTGVGLANVKRIITRHGGRVWAEGEVDHGATFYFTLDEAI